MKIPLIKQIKVTAENYVATKPLSIAEPPKLMVLILNINCLEVTSVYPGLEGTFSLSVGKKLRHLCTGCLKKNWDL